MKKKIGALLFVVLMMITMTARVSAEEGSTGSADISVTKQLVIAEGTEVPDATFSFQVTKKTADAPDATIQDISFTSTDEKGELSDRVYRIFKDSPVQFGTFPHAGVYEYEVKENNTNVEGVTYSANTYALHVNVVNTDEGNLKISSIVVKKDGEKQDKMLFINKYVKRGNQLVISKKTEGTLADRTKTFQFKLMLMQPPTETADQAVYEATVEDEGGVTGTVNFTSGVEATFTLRHGQKLTFTDLPAGTRYIVTEVGVEDRYVPSVLVTENGTARPVQNGGDAIDLSVNSALVGQNGENSAVFTNTYQETPVTGLFTDNLPFLLMSGLAGCAFVGLGVMKRRNAHN